MENKCLWVLSELRINIKIQKNAVELPTDAFI